MHSTTAVDRFNKALAAAFTFAIELPDDKSVADIHEMLKDFVTRGLEKCRRSEDIPHTLHLVYRDADGQRILRFIHAAAILSDVDTKDICAEWIYQQVSSVDHIEAYAFTSMAWALEVSADEALSDDLPRPSESPNRAEVVTISTGSADGFRASMAHVHRLKKVTAGKWIDHPIITEREQLDMARQSWPTIAFLERADAA